MNNLIDLQNQIEKLQKQANDIKAKEFRNTVQEIISTMKAFGITAKDLQSVNSRRGKVKAAVSAKRAGAKTAKTAAVPVAAKYRGPNGETWSGRGLTPKWLAALMTQGQSKEDFVIRA